MYPSVFAPPPWTSTASSSIIVGRHHLHTFHDYFPSLDAFLQALLRIAICVLIEQFPFYSLPTSRHSFRYFYVVGRNGESHDAMSQLPLKVVSSIWHGCSNLSQLQTSRVTVEQCRFFELRASSLQEPVRICTGVSSEKWERVFGLSLVVSRNSCRQSLAHIYLAPDFCISKRNGCFFKTLVIISAGVATAPFFCPDWFRVVVARLGFYGSTH